MFYSKDDRDKIKVLKYNQDLSKDLGDRIDAANACLDARIAESKALLQDLGYDTDEPSLTHGHTKLPNPQSSVYQHSKSYDEILQEANQRYGDEVEFGFEDILSSMEIERAYRRVEEINREFSKITGFSKLDLSFLILASALQTAKWVLLPAIGESFDPEERKTHDDEQIKQEHEDILDNFKHKHYSGNGQSEDDWKTKEKGEKRKSWIEILYTKAPYDKIKGTAALGLDINGRNHRVKTLGHDPILGWIFGTANFMTDTATLINFDSYRVRDASWVDEQVPLPQLFSETIDLTRTDWHCLAAALVAQGAHLKSDEYTKMGLPVPILSTLNEEWASKLYSEHYDSLCLQRDVNTVVESALTSIFINMIISFIHGMFYDPAKHGKNKDLYEVRTRKILLLSNSIATSSNLVYTCITKNPHKLDIGGILVTLSRLFFDLRFIARVKEEFIQNALDKDMNRTLAELDDLEKQIICGS